MDFRQPKAPKICAVIRGKSPCTSMCYHEDGNHLFVTSEADSRLRLVDCQRGISDTPAIKFERDGVRLVETTHHNRCVLVTGKGDKTLNVGQRHPINYLSLHDNKILRQFRGCGAEVCDLSLSPIDDSFLSCSGDRTVRLWNLQQAGSLAILDLPKSGNGYNLDPTGVPHATYDSTGLVFCITAPLDAGAGHLLHLYDARKYSSGAFAELKLENALITRAIQQKVSTPELASELSNADWNSIKFDKSGKHILVTTSKGSALLLDGYDGSIVNVFVGEKDNVKQPMAACFSSDDKTVLGGNADGTISCWDTSNGELIKTLQGHVGRVGCLASNPKYAQIASSCTNTALWLW
jgi:WD40 repeat protein